MKVYIPVLSCKYLNTASKSFFCAGKSRKPKFANVPYQTFEIGLVDCFVDLSRKVSLVGLAFHLVVLCLELVCLVELFLVEVCLVELFPSEGEVSSEEPHPRSLRSRPNPFSLFSVVLVGVCLVPGVPGLAVTSLAEEVLYLVDR